MDISNFDSRAYWNIQYGGSATAKLLLVPVRRPSQRQDSSRPSAIALNTWRACSLSVALLLLRVGLRLRIRFGFRDGSRKIPLHPGPVMGDLLPVRRRVKADRGIPCRRPLVMAFGADGRRRLPGFGRWEVRCQTAEIRRGNDSPALPPPRFFTSQNQRASGNHHPATRHRRLEAVVLKR